MDEQKVEGRYRYRVEMPPAHGGFVSAVRLAAALDTDSPESSVAVLRVHRRNADETYSLRLVGCLEIGRPSADGLEFERLCGASVSAEVVDAVDAGTMELDFPGVRVDEWPYFEWVDRSGISVGKGAEPTDAVDADPAREVEGLASALGVSPEAIEPIEEAAPGLTASDYAEAMQVQNACNLSGVVASFAIVLKCIWAQARIENRGTEWVNRHPISVLYASKIASLAGSEMDGAFADAYRECARRSGQ